MILHLTKENLEWIEIQHHDDFVRLDSIVSILQAEVFYYKNDDITIRATIKIIEHARHDNKFEVLTNSYAHVHPDMIRLEFKDGHKLGDFATLEEAKDVAQMHFNHHHHTKYQHHH